jgi:hypothetical protein
MELRGNPQVANDSPDGSVGANGRGFEALLTTLCATGRVECRSVRWLNNSVLTRPRPCSLCRECNEQIYESPGSSHLHNGFRVEWRSLKRRFVIFGKGTAGCRVPWHWHTPTEQLMMVTGRAKVEMKDGARSHWVQEIMRAFRPSTSTNSHARRRARFSSSVM